MDQTSQRLTSAPAASRADQADKPEATTDVAWPRFLTRKQLLEFLNSQGIPIGKSTLDKLCALGQGPPVAAWWGRLALHRPAESLSWAMARLRLARGVTRSGDTAPDAELGLLAAPLAAEPNDASESAIRHAPDGGSRR
jgi:hypothetical protein